MNPLAIIFWIICSIAGYLFGGFDGLLIGLLISMTISFLAGIFL